MKLRIEPRRHCSDEQLLAWLDGELQPTAARWVQSHLKICWECRARLQDIDGQVSLVVETLIETRHLEMDRAARAKAVFLAWRRYTPAPPRNPVSTE
jgi:anti-sigma factor RsiW